MKRWFSGVCAFLTLVVVSAALYGSVVTALTQFKPVSVSAQSLGTPYNSFSAYQNWFANKGVTLSSASSAQIKNASWQSVSSTDADLLKAASMLQDEWQKYPNSSIKKSGLKRVYLVKELYVDGQYRSGMPEPVQEHALYFDVSSDYLASEDGAYMRRVFHHEFSHLIEYDLFGSYRPYDAAWTSCNNAGVTYGNGGPSMYNDPEYAHAVHPLPGFVDGYATSGEEEDKAEVYAAYMTTPDALQKLAASDTHLACKVTQTEALLTKL